MRLVICYLLLLSSSLSALGNSNCENEKIEGHLNRANSFYWLSRSRQNSLFEANLSKFQLDSALLILKSADLAPECVSDYMEFINSFSNDLDELIAVTKVNLNGRYPLIPFITNEYPELEYYDNPLETAAEDALSSLLESVIYKPSKELKDVLLFCVIEVEGDQSLKEVVVQYLNIHSKMYVITDHEILTALGSTDLQDSSLMKLGEYFSTNYFGKIVIKEYDNSDDISYVGARFEFYNLSKNELISNTYAEGMKVNVKGRNLTFFQFFSILLLIVFVILFLLFLLYKKVTKDQGSSLNFVTALLGGLFLGLITSIGTVELFSLFAPSGGDFMEEPFVYIWPYLLSFGAVTLPVLCFILSGLFLKRRLSDSGPLIFVFIASASIAIISPVLKAHFVYLGIQTDYTLILAYVISIVVISFGSSIWLRHSFKNNKGIFSHLVPIALFIPIGLIYNEALRGGTNHLMEFDLYITLLSLVVGLLPLVLIVRKSKKDSSVRNDAKREPLQLQKLKKLISEQLKDEANEITVDFNKGYFEHFNGLLNDFSGFKHLHISGSSGIGKTTFIRNFVIEKKDSWISFYGDCDEDQEGAVIPYEPFYQAFSESVGEGAFYDGAADASDLMTKVKPLLNAAGVGGISESLTSKNQSFNGASVKEILQTIKNHISKVKREQKSNRVIIIIEDIHWIDDYTKLLLKESLLELSTFARSKRGGVDILLLTTSSSKEDDKFSDILEQSANLAQNDENYSYSLWGNSKEEEFKIDNLANNDFIHKLLSRTNSKLLISPSAINGINKFVQRTLPVNPRYSLEVLRYFVDNDLIIEVQGVLIVKDDLDWDTIPFEGQIEELYFNQFSALPEDVLKVLESAAFVGMEFEAELLSKLWKIDRIELIHNLLKAEKSGLVIDINDQDDWYRFGSKALRAALKRFSMTDQIQKGKIPQIVKEYHREIIRITLEKYNVDSDFSNLSVIPTNALFQLVDRVLIVNHDRPENGMNICAEGMIRTISMGDMNRTSTYISFLIQIDFDVLAKSNTVFSSFLTGIMFEVSSDPDGYFKRKEGTVLIKYLEDVLFSKEINNSQLLNRLLESYLELCLKAKTPNSNTQSILDKYKDNNYTKLYKILLNRKENNRFSDKNISDLTSLWTELKTIEDKNIKGIILGNLSMVSSGDEALYFLKERVKMITEKCGNNDEVLDIIECLEQNLNDFNFNELNNIGFICAGFNGYLNQTKSSEGEKYLLNKFRLKVNTKLNHSLAMFFSSIEMISHPSEFVPNELFEFSQSLFFNYTKGSFRAQLYTLWLRNTLLSGNKDLMLELGVATKIMMESVGSDDFILKDERQYLPVNLLKELLKDDKLNNTDERKVTETLYALCD